MTGDSVEIEQQYEAPDLGRVQAWLEAQPAHATIAIKRTGVRDQHDTYYDTADWAIYRAGYALRLRQKGDVQEATLKALSSRSAGAQHRREVNQLVEADDWAVQSGLVADKVRLITGGMPFLPLFAVKNRRATYDLKRDGAVQAELCLDDAEVQQDEATLLQLRRVEIEEQRPGGLEAIEVLVEALRRACELAPDETSKFEAGVRVAGLNPKAATNLGDTSLSPEASAPEYAYAVLRRYLRDFLAHEPGTRLGEDPEELHDSRVATRRLRAAIKTFAGVLPPDFQAYRDELKWLGGALGEVRDFDVQLEWLQETREASGWEDGTALGPLIVELNSRREDVREKMLTVLQSERYRTLRDGIMATLRLGPEPVEEAEPIRAFAAALLKKDYRKFRRDADALEPESEASLYHATRIRGKRLRYALEAMQPVFERTDDGMVPTMRSIQDLLGDMQDCNVSIDLLRDLVSTGGSAWPPATLVRTGELIEQRRALALSLRGHWPGAWREGQKQWKRQRRAMRRSLSRTRDDEEDESEDASSVPRQGRFAIFRRFFRRR